MTTYELSGKLRRHLLAIARLDAVLGDETVNEVGALRGIVSSSRPHPDVMIGHERNRVFYSCVSRPRPKRLTDPACGYETSTATEMARHLETHALGKDRR